MGIMDIKKNASVEHISPYHISQQLADGLDYAHARQVIHRDLNPANTCLTEVGQAVIVDFGLARLLELGRDENGKQAGVLESTLSGTAAYMAPEQAAGEVVGPAAD